jgi:hypothetical protein
MAITFSSMLFFIYSILLKNEKNLQYGHCRNKMKNKTNNKLSKQPQNQIIKLWKEANPRSIPLTHKYMTTHFPGLVQALLKKVTGLN